jgi:general secretion pathway protein I
MGFWREQGSKVKSRGFTLLEMMVATTIMAIAVVGLMASLSGAARNAARLRDYDRAVQLARLRMNELQLDVSFPRNSEVSGQFDRSLTSGLECGWRARVSLWKTPPYPVVGEFALERLDLEVWWAAGASRRTLTMSSYRRHVLTADEAAQLAAAQ